MSDKSAGQGKGKFTKAGVQADQEARLAAIEDFLEAEFPEFGDEEEEASEDS